MTVAEVADASVDAFEPSYSPRKIEFWLAHWEELQTLVDTPRSAAHIAEHLNREWMMLQARNRYCLCHELHAIDSLAVDPACTHSPSGGGGYRRSSEAVLCIYADLHKASGELPAPWSATQRIWFDQRVPRSLVSQRVASWRKSKPTPPEPIFARTFAVMRMAESLGWTRHG